MDSAERRQLIKEKMKIFHLDIPGGGVVTLAVICKETDTNCFDLYYGASYCCPKDQFCKSEGRLNAVARLSTVMREDYKQSYSKGGSFYLNSLSAEKHNPVQLLFKIVYNSIDEVPLWLEKAYPTLTQENVIPRYRKRKKYNNKPLRCCTPNHKVLTDKGWEAIYALGKTLGDGTTTLNKSIKDNDTPRENSEGSKPGSKT